jgi:hypothetical protein
MQTLSTLSSADERNSKFLILLPSETSGPLQTCSFNGHDQPCPINFLSGLQAINILMRSDAREERPAWKDRSIRFQKEMSSSKNPDDCSVKIYNFLAAEISQTSNKKIREWLRDQVDLCGNAFRNKASLYPLLSRVSFLFHCKMHGISNTRWSPEDSSQSLESLLKAKGPLLVFGKLGPSSYEAPAAESGKFLGKPFFAWEKGAQKKQDAVAQAVIIVGIWTGISSSLVSFIDPSESIDASTERALYLLSYDKFVDSISRVTYDEEQAYAFFCKHFSLIQNE